jgi:hypothetical protein
MQAGADEAGWLALGPRVARQGNARSVTARIEECNVNSLLNSTQSGMKVGVLAGLLLNASSAAPNALDSALCSTGQAPPAARVEGGSLRHRLQAGRLKRWVALVKLQTGVGNIRSVPESEIVKQIEKVCNRVVIVIYSRVKPAGYVKPPGKKRKRNCACSQQPLIAPNILCKRLSERILTLKMGLRQDKT